jgi:c-di-GMP-binding flagellar brake protein YcgR
MIEKREYLRLPIMHQIGEPIDMVINGKISQGVIMDLSAGGMSILGYINIMVDSEIKLTIDTRNLKTKSITGKAIWTKAEINMYKTGIHFTEIEPIDFIHINRMGVDCNDCDARIAASAKDVCFPKCHFHGLCNKSQKIQSRK